VCVHGIILHEPMAKCDRYLKRVTVTRFFSISGVPHEPTEDARMRIKDASAKSIGIKSPLAQTGPIFTPYIYHTLKFKPFYHQKLNAAYLALPLRQDNRQASTYQDRSSNHCPEIWLVHLRRVYAH
jgi:hypothetical protein